MIQRSDFLVGSGSSLFWPTLTTSTRQQASNFTNLAGARGYR